MAYILRVTETYQQQKKKPTDLQKQLQRTEERLRRAPTKLAHSEELKAGLKGKRSCRIKSNWRLIFTICEECREAKHQDTNLLDCPGCADQSDKTVNLLYIMDYH